MAQVVMKVDYKKLSGVYNKLNRLKNVLLSPQIISAMETWAKLVRDAARKFVPVKSGALRDDINHYILRRTLKIIQMKITTKPKSDKGREYAFYLEFGTSPHFIMPVNAAALHWKDSSGQSRFSKGHLVSGIHARRFMLRAYLSTKKAGGLLLANAVRQTMKGTK